MFVHTVIEVVAWSADGGSALLRFVSDGPEGGGAITYEVQGPAGAEAFDLTETFSPGDGSTPEHVSAADCRERAGQLATRLAAAGFVGVDVKAGRCNEDRAAIVEVRAEPPRRADEVAGVRIDGETLRIDGGQDLALGAHADVDLWSSPTGKRLIVVLADPWGNQRIGAAVPLPAR